MSGAKEKLFPLEISRLWRNSYSHIFNLVFNNFFTFMVQRLKKGSQTQIAPSLSHPWIELAAYLVPI